MYVFSTRDSAYCRRQGKIEKELRGMVWIQFCGFDKDGLCVVLVVSLGCRKILFCGGDDKDGRVVLVFFMRQRVKDVLWRACLS